MIKLTRHDMLLAVTVAFVAGALLHRVFPVAGLILVALALLFYIYATYKRAIPVLKQFKKADVRSQVRAGIWCAMILMVLKVLVVMLFHKGDVAYFLVLVFLAVDFLMRQNPGDNEVVL